MLITAIDGIDLNGVSGITVVFELTTNAGAFSGNPSLRQRSYQSPALENYSFNAREQQTLVTIDKPNWSGSLRLFDETIQGLFPADGRNRILSGTREGMEYELVAYVKAFQRPNFGEWYITWVLLDPYWRATTALGPVTTSPLANAGNVVAKPIITITGGQATTRRRVTVSDRSGHGFAGWPIPVNVGSGLAESKYRVYVNLWEAPFVLSDGYLYVPVDSTLRPGQSQQQAIIDVIGGASISKGVKAGQWDPAGLTLDPAIGSGTIDADPSNAASNHLSANPAWHQGIVVKPSESRQYTFGLDAGAIRLIDREATGQRWDLPNDIDSYILTSSIPMASISGLDLSVFAGFRQGTNSATGAATERVMRVRILTSDGGDSIDAPTWDPALLENQDVPGATYSAPTHYPGYANNDYLTYVQFTLNGAQFPDTHTREGGAGLFTGFAGTASSQGTRWIDDYMPWDLPALIAQYFPGVTVETGAAGWFYLHFPDDVFGGQNLSLLSMTMQPKGGSWTLVDNDGNLGYTLTMRGTTVTDDALSMQADWVDPDTLEPLDATGTDGVEPTDDLVGKIKAFVRYQLRDSEQWLTAWEHIYTGAAPDGTTISINPGTLDLHGAINVAVGIAPAASNPNTLDWGTLQMTSTPTITLQAGATPSVVVNSVAGQRLDGVLVNATTGKQMTFRETLSDAGGLVIDSDTLAISGLAANVVYNAPTGTGGTRYFDLTPGANAWSVSGDMSGATVSFGWQTRLAVNS